MIKFVHKKEKIFITKSVQKGKDFGFRNQIPTS
jgi:hypothetical protein